MTELLPDGVWLNLPAEEYFGQGLGSTDLIGLYKRKLGWWWSSHHNPRHKRKETAAQTYGSALHAIILEGEKAYAERFAVRPPIPIEAIDTILEMKARLLREGYRFTGTAGWTKDDWLKAMRDNLPRAPVTSNLLADWRKTIGDQVTEISADDDWCLRFMRDVIHDTARADNVEIRELFAENADRPPLAEVSIFATEDYGFGPVRRRWRIDRMFPAFDMDLKSLGAWRGRPLKFEIGDLIAKYAYDLQRADYFDGRTAAYEHIRAGRVYGGTAEQRRWLMRFPDSFPTWDWVWMFYQKPDLVAGHAPVVFPVWDDTYDGPSTPSARRRSGMLKKANALALYQRAVAEFGLDKPWAHVETLHYADDRRSPSVSFPHWIDEDDPTEEAAYA